MPVNSISPGQSVQQAQSVQQNQAVRKSDAADARKQADIRSDDRVQEKKMAADQNARIEKTHSQQQAEKSTVNTNGQKIGTRINTAA